MTFKNKRKRILRNFGLLRSDDSNQRESSFFSRWITGIFLALCVCVIKHQSPKWEAVVKSEDVFTGQEVWEADPFSVREEQRHDAALYSWALLITNQLELILYSHVINNNSIRETNIYRASCVWNVLFLTCGQRFVRCAAFLLGSSNPRGRPRSVNSDFGKAGPRNLSGEVASDWVQRDARYSTNRERRKNISTRVRERRKQKQGAFEGSWAWPGVEISRWE